MSTEALTEALTVIAEGSEPDHEQVEAIREALKLLHVGAELLRPGDLFTTNDAAVFLGADRTTVGRWRRGGYMPKPFQELAGAPVWTRATLEEFRDAHRSRADAAGRRPLGTAR